MIKTLMNIVRLSFFMLALHVGLAKAVQSPEYMAIHGSACQPVNLTQAINLNITWTKDGIFNPNPLNSGIFFFVACPLVTTDDQSAAPGSDVFVMLFYNDRTADLSTRTFCFVQRQSNSAPYPGNVRTVSDTDTSAGTGPALSGFALFDIIQDSDRSFNANTEALVAVCKIYPQAGIMGFSVDHD